MVEYGDMVIGFKVLMALTVVLFIYLMSDDMSEVRVEFDRALHTGHNNRYSDVSLEKMTGYGGVMEKIKGYVFGDKTSGKFEDYNDFVLYNVFVLGMLIIMIMSVWVWKGYQEEVFNGESSMGVYQGLRMYGSSMVSWIVLVVIFILVRNMVDMGKMYRGKGQKSLYSINSKDCSMKIEVLAKKIFGEYISIVVGSGIGVLVIMMMCVVFSYYTVLSVDIYREEETMYKEEMLMVCPIMLMVCFVWVSYYWLSYGCRGVLLGRGSVCKGSMYLMYWDKVSIIVMVLVMVGVVMGWGIREFNEKVSYL